MSFWLAVFVQDWSHAMGVLQTRDDKHPECQRKGKRGKNEGRAHTCGGGRAPSAYPRFSLNFLFFCFLPFFNGNSTIRNFTVPLELAKGELNKCGLPTILSIP
jgi:hypothetical protein